MIDEYPFIVVMGLYFFMLYGYIIAVVISK